MKRFATAVFWLAKYADGLIALSVAAVLAVMDLFSLGGVNSPKSSAVSGGILLVLTVLAFTTLRDRARSEETESKLRALTELSADLLPTMAARLERLTDLEQAVGVVGRALDDSSMVSILSSTELTVALREARRTTDRWLFRGGTGTYIRAVTLPQCVANARGDRRELQIRLEIIDPSNEMVCDRYARFRRSLSSTEAGWTIDRTRRESLATIVAACYYRQRYELLDIEIGLSSVMPTLRWDLSAPYLIITQEDPRGRALMIRSGKVLYDYLQTELRQSFDQVRRVPMDVAPRVPLSDSPTVDEVRRLLTALGMPLPSSVTDVDVKDIIVRALRAENVYDR